MNKKKGFPKLFKKLGIYAFWLLRLAAARCFLSQ